MENLTEKEILINAYIADGFSEVDVTKVPNVCKAFTGDITEDGVKTDTDGSKYVTVIDQDDNAFDVDIDKIDLP